MQQLYLIPEDFAEYLSGKNHGQLIAHLELLGSLIFFATENAIGSDHPERSNLDPTKKKASLFFMALNSDWNLFRRSDVIPLSIDLLGRVGRFSKQKYETIREKLAEMGLFSIERQEPRMGERLNGRWRQKVTNVFALDHVSIVMMIRAIYDHLLSNYDCLVEGFFPEHGFNFLNNWHNQVFGFRLDDLDELTWRRGRHLEMFGDDIKHKSRVENAITLITAKFASLGQSVSDSSDAFFHAFFTALGRPDKAEKFGGELTQPIAVNSPVPEPKAEKIGVAQRLLAFFGLKPEDPTPSPASAPVSTPKPVQTAFDKRRQDAIDRYNAAAGHSEG